MFNGDLGEYKGNSAINVKKEFEWSDKWLKKRIKKIRRKVLKRNKLLKIKILKSVLKKKKAREVA